MLCTIQGLTHCVGNKAIACCGSKEERDLPFWKGMKFWLAYLSSPLQDHERMSRYSRFIEISLGYCLKSCPPLAMPQPQTWRKEWNHQLSRPWALDEPFSKLGRKKRRRNERNLRGIRVNINYTWGRIHLINDNINPWLSGTILLTLLL